MRAGLIIAALAASACASMSPASRLENRFIAFGMEPPMAACLAGELDEDLTGRELGAVADFLERFEDADRGRPGAAIDAVMSMDNPEIVASIAAAGIACAFRR
jgi:hypothetical protein